MNMGNLDTAPELNTVAQWRHQYQNGGGGVEKDLGSKKVKKCWYVCFELNNFDIEENAHIFSLISYCSKHRC